MISAIPTCSVGEHLIRIYYKGKTNQMDVMEYKLQKDGVAWTVTEAECKNCFKISFKCNDGHSKQ